MTFSHILPICQGIGSLHKQSSPTAKTLCNFKPQFGLAIITSGDAKHACFRGSGTSSQPVFIKRVFLLNGAFCRSICFGGARGSTLCPVNILLKVTRNRVDYYGLQHKNCSCRLLAGEKCYNRGRKRRINIWHINNFSVTLVTDPPGRVPNPPGRIPGRKFLYSLGSAHSTQTFDPWPPVGRPLATWSGGPPHGQSAEKFIYVYVPFPFLIQAHSGKSTLWPS